jgi:gluconate kinase
MQGPPHAVASAIDNLRAIRQRYMAGDEISPEEWKMICPGEDLSRDERIDWLKYLRDERDVELTPVEGSSWLISIEVLG